MPKATQIGIPTLVRIKPGALPRSGLYLARAARRHVLLLSSAGTPPAIRLSCAGAGEAGSLAIVAPGSPPPRSQPDRTHASAAHPSSPERSLVKGVCVLMGGFFRTPCGSPGTALVGSRHTGTGETIAPGCNRRLLAAAVPRRIPVVSRAYRGRSPAEAGGCCCFSSTRSATDAAGTAATHRMHGLGRRDGGRAGTIARAGRWRDASLSRCERGRALP